MSELDYISRIPRRIEYDDGIRRAFNPSLIAGCMGWWRSDMGITLNVNKVVSWADSSGRGNTLSQGVDANRPVYNTNALNGRQTLSFSDASATVLSSSSADLAPSNVTMIVVARRTATQSIMFVGGRGDTGNAGYWIGEETNDALEADFGNGASGVRPSGGAGSWPITTWFVFSSVFDSVKGYIYKNGTQLASSPLTGSLGYAANPTFFLGNVTGLVAGRGLTGDVAEVVVFNRALLLPELNRVHKYMGFLYGITVSG